MFLREPADTAARTVPRAPGDRDDATNLVPSAPSPQSAPAAPAPAGHGCSACGYRNEPARIRCERCGAELRSAWPAPVMLSPPPPPTTPPQRRSRTWLAPLLAVLALSLLATGSYVVSRSPDTPKIAAAPVPVNPREVSVIASSISRDSRFPPANVIDGDRRTMWQTDGKRPAGNAGTTLVFRFTKPVVLARITVVNGAAVSRKAYRENERLRRVVVTTDTAATSWDLLDSADPQSLALRPRPTSTVTLTVEKTYTSAKYPNLAVTDVGFHRQP
jgi:zinc finger protein